MLVETRFQDLADARPCEPVGKRVRPVSRVHPISCAKQSVSVFRTISVLRSTPQVQQIPGPLRIQPTIGFSFWKESLFQDQNRLMLFFPAFLPYSPMADRESNLFP